jgi:hypothetical protein
VTTDIVFSHSTLLESKCASQNALYLKLLVPPVECPGVPQAKLISRDHLRTSLDDEHASGYSHVDNLISRQNHTIMTNTVGESNANI